MHVLSTVSQQWASRPDDQRFLTMAELSAKVRARREGSRVTDMALEHLQVRADKAGNLLLGSEAGALGALTHWTFGQLATRAKAPAGYLRQLPPDLAAINLQWSLEHADQDDGKILTYDKGATVGAITSPTYGRIWDSEVVASVLDKIDLNTWKVPGASYASKDPKRATTLYASDRDVFLFLVDESRPIEVEGTRLHRGFYIQNSETMAGSFVIATMLYEYVCDNRNIWGPRDFKEIRIRHTAGGPHRFMHQAVPQLSAYAQASATPITAMVKAASAKEVGKDRKAVTEWLKSRGFGLKLAADAYDSAEANGRNPRSLWGAAWGITDVAHKIGHTNDRMDVERKAGELLSMAETLAA